MAKFTVPLQYASGTTNYSTTVAGNNEAMIKLQLGADVATYEGITMALMWDHTQRQDNGSVNAVSFKLSGQL
ncbi:MAG: hypothetical protein QF872_02250 [Gammaproteobacteria bacterium]|nr:hypothetical protein [Gammaproteobacteria bacterium]